jgi:cytoskeleton protein RodZ
MNAAGDSNHSGADDSAQASAPERAESLTPGEILRRERERRSITLLHIAEELHLDARMVQAIEGNRFGELGVPVYARGHLRQYAALLGVSPQLIIERYEALTGRQEVQAPIPASVAVGLSVGMERRSLAGPLWMGVALIALLLGWWIWSAVLVPGDPMQGLNEEFATEPESTGDPSLTTQEGAATPAPEAGQSASAAAVQTTNASAPAAGAVSLRIEFNEASWTEIEDATGKRLMYGMGESGRTRTLSGTPPLRVTFGKASAVTVQVNDRPIVVPRRAGKDAAKFVIAAGGTVQMVSGEVPVE